jgi:hypothetical protein
MKAMQVALWAASSDAILIAMQFFTVFKKWKEIDSDCKACVCFSFCLFRLSQPHLPLRLEISKQALSDARRAKPPREIAGEQVRVSQTLSASACSSPPPLPASLSLVFSSPKLPITMDQQPHSCLASTIDLLNLLAMPEHIPKLMCVTSIFRSCWFDLIYHEYLAAACFCNRVDIAFCLVSTYFCCAGRKGSLTTARAT